MCFSFLKFCSFFFSNVVGDDNDDLVGGVPVGMGDRGTSKVFRLKLG